MYYQHLIQVKDVADVRRAQLQREARSMRLLRLVKRDERKRAPKDVAQPRSENVVWKRAAV